MYGSYFILQMKALKELGQHFLKSSSLAASIAELGDLKDGESVWEIGSGKGILTEALLKYPIRLRAFELDRRLFEELKANYGDRVDFVFKDVLRADWPELITLDKPPLKLIANIPYQITTPLLSLLEKHHDAFQRVVLMVQKEMGERLAASAGSKSYAPLTIRLKLNYNIAMAMAVPRTEFEPEPKVDSVVIVMNPRPDKPFIKEPQIFGQVLDAAFAHRRKTLANNLLPLLGKERFMALQQSSKLDFKRRGETLEEAEFIHLSELVAAL